MKLPAVFVATLALCAHADWASAHFLFLRIGAAAEGGRAAEVYFSEYATAGDPRFIDKIASGKFLLQVEPGKLQPLAVQKLSDRLRAHVPVSGPLMVAGQVDYGVLHRPGAPPFLLRHYCKAVAGGAAPVNALATVKTPLEMTASFDDERVVLTLLLDGKPLPDTTLNTVDAELAGEELKTDANGQAAFAPEHAGLFCVYAGHTRPTSGEHDGRKCDEVREFATISFGWPLAPHGADPQAVALFEDALAGRAAWHDFVGFSAKVAGQVEGRPFAGRVTVAADGTVSLDLDDEALAPWVSEQLESITMHRAASQAPGPDRPKPVLRFADDQVDHPLGRLLAFEGGQFATSYRVRQGQITSVNRVMDGQNMTITVLDNQQNAEGKFLPRAYVVQYWDEPTGRLLRSESVQDRWVRVGSWDLPAEHTVAVSSGDGFAVRSFGLSDHQVPAAAAAGPR